MKNHAETEQLKAAVPATDSDQVPAGHSENFVAESFTAPLGAVNGQVDPLPSVLGLVANLFYRLFYKLKLQLETLFATVENTRQEGNRQVPLINVIFRKRSHV